MTQPASWNSILCKSPKREREKPSVSTFDLINARIQAAVINLANGKHALGLALYEMHESELWREKYETWQAYIESLDSIGLRHANSLRNAESARKALEMSGNFGAMAPLLTDRAARELAKEPTPEAQVEIVNEIIESKQPVTSATVKKQREKRAAAKVVNPATGEPEQQQFDFKASVPIEAADAAKWFQSITDHERAKIITEAQRAATP